MRKLFFCMAALLLQTICTVVFSQTSEVNSAVPAKSLFRFIINRGEVFSANAPGELTELTLSGYFCTENEWEGQLTPDKSANSVSLTGKAIINDYNMHLQTKVIASLSMPSIVSPTGLFLTLIVDGCPMTVQLPYINENDNWPVGYAYIYNVTVEGRGLTISGVTYAPLEKE
ncbi:hypothetical protein [Bacteroides nordii]|mgnify:CR=1 FL=1|uniref:hypothetical protein n=1 Tax=Bacteroides nordii TaxID=291645 RepID=UPI00399B23C2